MASCHFDIMEWLLPDWTYSPLKGRVERHDYRRHTRPKIELSIFRCRYETWNIFKQHHYLTQDLNKSAICYLINWNDKPVAFIAILPFVGVGDAKTRVISRIVVLPDYQGLGIGKHLINYISALYASIGSKMYIRTINPAIGIALCNDENWKPTSKHLKEVTDGSQPNDTKKQKRLRRLSYSLKYEGEPSQDNNDLITFNADAWKEVAQNQISLF